MIRFYSCVALGALCCAMTGARAAPVSISLGTASSFAVLSGTTVTNTGSTVINGNLGVSPGTAVTGFPPGIVVNGTIHAGDGVAAAAQADLAAAYAAAASATPDATLTGSDLGGRTFTPGTYRFAAAAQLTGTLTLDGGGTDAPFLFQVGSALTTASNSIVLLVNAGVGTRVVFQVGSSATLGTSTTFVGSILALSSITLDTGAVIQSGGAFAREGAVTLDGNTVSAAAALPTGETAIPEPASALVLGLGTLMAAAGRRRRVPHLA